MCLLGGLVRSVMLGPFVQLRVAISTPGGMMPTAQGPAGPRRRLGVELRQLRRRAGLQLVEVAQELDCSASKISRLENGKGIPRMPDVVALMELYSVSDDGRRERLTQLVHESREQGWWERYTDGVQAERFVMNSPARYTALETEAVRVSSFEVMWVHGLLQVPDYTRAVLAELLSRTTDDQVEKLVELRLRRQEALTRRVPPLELVVVLDESVLSRVVGSPDVMAAQMRHLRERSELSNVTIRVLPFTVGLHRAHAGPFQILEFPDQAGSDVVFVEGPSGDTYENESDVDMYKDVLADVADRALGPDASREIVHRYELQHAPPGGRPR
ncbi:helix-turn-helix domain-containing protein [Pseudonocardia sp. DSM 110487]|jgi:transcriptional regulator with XRE-family HTH domain|uniref:helix-turn-helix domain-containing protein n=1 Tax=Pseudonocardia sp. DSM 110487 TaxID=2865833 RepID=UPI001C6A898A|nr:helix-turn-helix transcriptional regulator [Pseudonocardia sp. DSM 110487]QYN36101.1 helix-turn-helix domain-containing protein [Pseudonocardia sp. DSM 110487]